MEIDKIYNIWLSNGVIRVSVFPQLEEIGLILSDEIKHEIVKEVRELLIEKTKNTTHLHSMAVIRSTIRKIKTNENNGKPKSEVVIACRAKLIKEVFEYQKEWDCGFDQSSKLVSDSYRMKYKSKNTPENDK